MQVADQQLSRVVEHIHTHLGDILMAEQAVLLQSERDEAVYVTILDVLHSESEEDFEDDDFLSKKNNPWDT